MLKGKAPIILCTLFAFVTLFTMHAVTAMASAPFEIVTEDTYTSEPSSTTTSVVSTSTVSPGEPVHGYILPDTDTRMYYRSDIENMPLQVVNYAKNEIYARHGRKFESTELTKYFSYQPWYNGTIEPDDFDEDRLQDVMNDTEIANITLLALYEIEITDNQKYQLDTVGYTYDKVSEYIRNHGKVTDETLFLVDQPSDDDFITIDTEPLHGYLMPDADTKFYTEEDISNMNAQLLCYARNEIYARHGYLFDSDELSTYFHKQPWYQALSDFDETIQDIEEELSYTETCNIALIAKIEEQLINPYQLDTSYEYDYSSISNYVRQYGLVTEDTTLH